MLVIEFLQIGLANVLLAIAYWIIDLVKKSRPRCGLGRFL
jgi:hypothetical protein